MRDDHERLLDIEEAIVRIERYLVLGRAEFDQSELIQSWMASHLQVIGEASRALSSAVRDRHPDIPWKQIISMRNILVHNYFKIDRDIVWNAVERSVPELKQRLPALLQDTQPEHKPGDAVQPEGE